MKWLLLSLLALCGCRINHFVLKDRAVNQLPEMLHKDSIVFLPPAFSLHNLDDRFKIKYSSPSFGRTDTFRSVLSTIIAKKQLKIDDGVDVSCLNNKMRADNWRDSVWYTLKPYRCVALKKHYYNVLVYTKLDVHEGVTYTAVDDPSSLMQSLVLVIKGNEVVYTRQYYSLVRADNKLLKQFEGDSKTSPYFEESQMKLVLGKVLNDLLDKIY